MASTPTRSAAAVAQPSDGTSFSEWISGAIEQGVKPEQALAVVGLGLMRGMGSGAVDLPLFEGEMEGEANVQVLKNRLETISLAIDTGAPLSTQEVTQLLGARPGTAVVRRAGVTARRLSRNVWQLSRSSETERTAAGYNEGFRRRL